MIFPEPGEPDRVCFSESATPAYPENAGSAAPYA
jgi:hypothetical protein